MPDDQPATGAPPFTAALGVLDPLVASLHQGRPMDVPTIDLAITYREREIDILCQEITVLQFARRRFLSEGQP